MEVLVYMLKRLIILLVFVVVVTSRVYPSASEAGAIFLTIFPGAKATAMSAAFSAVADDATASYYNPGALPFFKNTQFSLIHAPWLPALSPDMFYDYAGFVKPLNQGTIGGHLIYLNLGEVVANDQSGNYLGSWKPYDMALTLSYGFKLNDNLGIGFSGKLIRSFLAPRDILAIIIGEPSGGTATTFAFDGGILYMGPFKGFSSAVVVQNLGPGVRYTGTGKRDPLPYLLRLGISYRPIWTEFHKVTLAFDINKILVNITRDLNKYGPVWVAWEAFKHFGIEYTLIDIISLRMGYFIDRDGAREGFTFGAGIRFKNFKFDIADDSRIYDFEETANRRFSLTYVMQK